MGLRAEAEKIIAREGRRRTESRERLLAQALAYVPAAMAGWAAAMGLDAVPAYTVTRNWMGHDDGRGPVARAAVAFTADGLDFIGEVSLPRQADPSFSVAIPGTTVRGIQSVAASRRRCGNSTAGHDERPTGLSRRRGRVRLRRFPCPP
jgi:hypothetical protein